MQISVETHDGKKYTVLRETNQDGIVTSITLLPALPRRPKPEHAPLLYRYMAEGIEPAAYYMTYSEEWLEAEHFIELLSMLGTEIKITHALLNGERVEIALEEAPRQKNLERKTDEL